MPERTPTRGAGIPLRELRENEPRLRRERGENSEGHTGATPIPVERESTNRLAGEFAHHTGNMGTVEPMDFENFIDRLASKLVEKGSGSGGDQGGGSGSGGKAHPEANAWIRWSLGALLAILSGWWVLGEKFAERPTVEQLKELRAPELEAVKRHEFEIREQRDSIIEMSGTLREVSKGVNDIQAELKSR